MRKVLYYICHGISFGLAIIGFLAVVYMVKVEIAKRSIDPETFVAIGSVEIAFGDGTHGAIIMNYSTLLTCEADGKAFTVERNL